MNNNNLMKYKEYYGSIHFDQEQEIFYGKVEFIRDLINFEAYDAKSLVQSFKNAIDEYLEDCKAIGKVPDSSFKGSFNIRISPDLHKNIGLYALQNHCSINNVVKFALKKFVNDHSN